MDPCISHLVPSLVPHGHDHRATWPPSLSRALALELGAKARQGSALVQNSGVLRVEGQSGLPTGPWSQKEWQVKSHSWRWQEILTEWAMAGEKIRIKKFLFFIVKTKTKVLVFCCVDLSEGGPMLVMRWVSDGWAKGVIHMEGLSKISHRQRELLAKRTINNCLLPSFVTRNVSHSNKTGYWQREICCLTCKATRASCSSL